MADEYHEGSGFQEYYDRASARVAQLNRQAESKTFLYGLIVVIVLIVLLVRWGYLSANTMERSTIDFGFGAKNGKFVYGNSMGRHTSPVFGQNEQYQAVNGDGLRDRQLIVPVQSWWVRDLPDGKLTGCGYPPRMMHLAA